MKKINYRGRIDSNKIKRKYSNSRLMFMKIAYDFLDTIDEDSCKCDRSDMAEIRHKTNVIRTNIGNHIFYDDISYGRFIDIVSSIWMKLIYEYSNTNEDKKGSILYSVVNTLYSISYYTS